jgi:hypothetical protein
LALQKGERYKSWAEISKWHFANATIARPHMDFIREPMETLKKIREIMSFAKENPKEANDQLDSLYRPRVDRTVGLLRKIFGHKNAAIIFEENGTNALALLRNMLASKEDVVLAATHEGRLVIDALKGINTVNRPENFRQPVGVFTPPKTAESFEGKVIQYDLIDGEGFKTNSQIFNEVMHQIRLAHPRLVVLPHVSRTGRILPVREIGRAIQKLNRGLRRKTYFIVDGIQAIGRLPQSEMRQPLRYVDAYVITSAKALGGPMQGAILLRKELLERHAKDLISSAYSPRLRFDQFHHEPKEITNFLNFGKKHYRVSLPEVESMGLSLEAYLSRRKNEAPLFRQLEAERKAFLSGISDLPGVETYESTQDMPMVPSIIPFKITTPTLAAADLKSYLQGLPEPITIPSLINGRIPRISLSELRHRTPQQIERVTRAIWNKIRISEIA